MGSMGYAIAAYVIGMISVKLGIRVIPVSFLTFFILLCIVVFLYPMNEAHAAKRSEKVKRGNALTFFCKYKKFSVMLFAYYMKKLSLGRLLQICGVFFTLKSIGSLLVTSIGSFYCVQLLQMLAWGILAVGLIYYVNQEIEEEDCAKGQAYATVTYTLGSVLGNFCGGRLIDMAGVNTMMIAGMAAAV